MASAAAGSRDSSTAPNPARRAVDPEPDPLAPLLVAGRVVDDRGLGIEARVQVAPRVPTSFVLDDINIDTDFVFAGGAEIGLTLTPTKPRVLFHKRPGKRAVPESARILAESELRVHRLGDGHFEVRGHTEASTLNLTAWPRMGQPTHHTCEIGDRDVRIVVPRTGMLRALIRLDRGLSAHDLELRLEPTSDPTAVRRLTTYGHRAHQREFAATEIPVGRYALLIALRENGTPLLRLDGLEIHADRWCADPRLRQIDLRGQARRIVVELQRPDGRALPLPEVAEHEVVARGPDGTLLPNQPTLAKSRVVVVTSDAYVDLTIRLPSFRPIHLPTLGFDRVVRVEPKIPVRLLLHRPAHATDRAIRVTLRQASTATEIGVSTTANSARLAIPEPGRYSIHAELTGPGGEPRPVEVEPAIIEISDVIGEQLLELTLR